MHKYGITLSEYEALLVKQCGLCAVCGNSLPTYPCVDHNHITGVVRALLCNDCNVLIGMAHEDIRILECAIAYIGEHALTNK